MKKGNLILCKSQYRNTEFSISVVLDNDVGNGTCHIRDIYRIDKGELQRTMNWSNIPKTLIEGLLWILVIWTIMQILLTCRII